MISEAARVELGGLRGPLTINVGHMTAAADGCKHVVHHALVTKHYGHLAPSHVADAIRAALPKFGPLPPDNVMDVRARKA